MGVNRLIALLSIVFFIGCETRIETVKSSGEAPVPNANYFPLIAESKHTYEYSFKGKRGSKTIITKQFIVDNSAVFFAVDEDDIAAHNPIIGSGLPGLGAYLRTDKGIATFHCTWKRELSMLRPSEMQLMLEFPLRKDSVTELADYDGEREITLRVAGFETVKVPAGSFRNCARIDVEKKWRSGEQYNSTFWLAPGIGVAKWRRATGRIDELTSFNIPGSGKK